MKALIIENEYEIPGEIRGFIKDNPNLFTEVREQIACKDMEIELLAPYIIKADALLIMSTFMYKDQLEEYVNALASKKLGTKKIFCFFLLRSLYEWFAKDKSFFFDDYEKFKQNIIRLVVEQEVYTIESDWDEEMIVDNYWLGCSQMMSDPNENKERYRYKYTRIYFDTKEKMFYSEGSSAKETINEYK